MQIHRQAIERMERQMETIMHMKIMETIMQLKIYRIELAKKRYKSTYTEKRAYKISMRSYWYNKQICYTIINHRNNSVMIITSERDNLVDR